ncbi:MAG: UDP-N-acetylglucosamine 2-epimerase (hydrolyzing) [Bdellovibrionales bacterium]|nr:UDP-N-acetylglucosamine 2-epimerase (hydrolyzing) [Bdellovibrionales bacterium]
MKRKICVATGTRAEFGLLRGLLQKMHKHKDVDLQLVVTGMHLCSDFGMTVSEIEDSGIPIRERVEMLLASDSPEAVTKSIGLGVIGFADVFSRLRPDLLVLLGDRFEALAAAQAAMVARIPIGHISGGEATEGLVDEAIRHSITKMSHFHFTATEVYRRRVIQLGEDPGRVFNAGSLAVDAIERAKLMSAKSLEESLGFRVDRETILVTHHPVTLGDDRANEEMRELLKVLAARTENRFLFTYPNADPLGRAIIRLIDDFISEHSDRAVAFPSLGQFRYLSAMKLCGVVMGNSSSGIVEAPALGVPTVNIGDRQRGRLTASSVVSCGSSAREIADGLEMALSTDFRARLKDITNPYGAGGAEDTILGKLVSVPLHNVLMKKFYDWESR